jgi:lysophospholipase L1-like esterase
MAPLPVINRGFGGATLPDVLHYARRIVLPYRPRLIVLYAGDNDLSPGGHDTAKDVLASFKKLVRLVRRKLPKTRIFFLAIKPSGMRWERWPRMKRANRMIRRLCARSRRLVYIDVATALLGDRGQVRDELFKRDRLHLNARGYAIWTSIVKPVISKAYASK